MAKTGPSSNRRSRVAAAKGAVRRSGNYYTDSTVARQLSAGRSDRRPATRLKASGAPVRTARSVPKEAPALSPEARRNREKALNINRGFVIFLACAMIMIMAVCIHYIQLRAEYTALISKVAAVESRLAQTKEDNDAYYSEVISDVDLSRIRKIAIARLGMQYPTEDQMEFYTTSEGSGYVQQFQDVPQ